MLTMNIREWMTLCLTFLLAAVFFPTEDKAAPMPLTPVVVDTIYDLGGQTVTPEQVAEMGLAPKPIHKAGDEGLAYGYSDYEIAMFLLKRNESLRLVPYWDVKQWTSGWGTKADGKHEVLTLHESNVRARDAFEGKFKLIKKEYPNLDRLQTLVIAQFIYNVGDGGIGNNLHKALKSGNNNRICACLKKYTFAGGKHLPGLAERRQRECDILLASPEKRQELAEEHRKSVVKSILKNQ